MGGKRRATRLRENLLRKRGMEKGQYGRLLVKGDEEREKGRGEGLPEPGSPKREGKTPLMLALEIAFHKDIDDLLTYEPNLHMTAMMLGLDESTVSKWRERRGLQEFVQELRDEKKDGAGLEIGAEQVPKESVIGTSDDSGGIELGTSIPGGPDW